jgi:hypothetical protein
MMKRLHQKIFTVLFVFLSCFSWGQTDDFTDGNFTANPTWSGDSGFAVINNSTVPGGNAATDGNYLASNSSQGSIALTTPSTEVREWKFSLASPDFDPSSTNHFGVILMSNNAVTGNITSNWVGYFLKLGTNGSSDKIELWKKTGSGTGTKVGDFSTAAYAAGALQNGLNIRITRSTSGVWQLYTSAGFTYASTPAIAGGTLTDNSYTTSSYFGVYQSFANASTSRRVYLDNVELGGQSLSVNTTGFTSNFGSVVVGSNSAGSSFTVSGSGLTSNVTVSAPNTNFQVSLSESSGYAASVSINFGSGTITNVPVYVRFTPQSGGAKSGNVTLSSGSATQNVAVSGTGLVTTVTTGLANAITSTGVTLNGTITNGNATAASFQYGLTTSYSSTISATPSSVTGTQNISAVVTGLSVNTLYNFRAVGGSATGSNATFYTLAATPLAPTVNGATTSSLQVTVNDNGATLYAVSINGGAISGYLNTDGTVSATPVWATAANWVDVTVGGLTPSTSYDFAVNAQNGSGVQTGFGPVTTATTSEATEPYLAPVNSSLSFGEVCLNNTNTSGFITFSGENFDTPTTLTISSATPDGAGGYLPLQGFSFGLNGGNFTNGTYTLNNFTGAEVTIEVHFTPTTAIDYSTTDILITYDNGGTITQLLAFDITSATGINTPATVITGAVSATAQFSATVNGQVTEACSEVTAYGIEYSTTQGFTDGSGTQVAGSNLSGSDYSVEITGLNACTTYYYKAYATDNAGTHYGSEQAFTTQVISAPVAIAATEVSETGFTANWNAVTGATEYRLDVSTSPVFETVVLDENFAGFTAPIGGEPDSDLAATNTLNNYTAVPGWTGSRIYRENGQIRLSNGSGAGEITTPTLDLSANGGVATFTFDAKLYNGNTPVLQVMHANNGTSFVQVGSNITPTENFATYSVTITNGTANSKIRIQTTLPNANNQRYQLDNFKIMHSQLVEGYSNLAVAGTSQEIEGLTPATDYYYRVRAVAGCTSENSNTVQTQTLAYLTLVEAMLDFGDVCLNGEGEGYFSFTGANMSNAVLNIPAIEGYSFSLTENGTYTETLQISGFNGQETTVYVKFTPAAVQAYTDTIVISGEAPYQAAFLELSTTANGINTPAVATAGTATDITMVSATLPAQITEGACSAIATYGIAYSTVNNFNNGSGTEIDGQDIDADGNFSVLVSGLAPCTTYYYKAYTTNADNVKVYGAQQQFNTLAISAPVATAGEAITESGFTATWEPVENADGYIIEVSTNPDFGGYEYADDLFISEYIEGSSNNKYLEIYNGTGSTVNLSDYKLLLFSNGSSTPNDTFGDVTLSGTLEDGATIVYKNASAAIYGGSAIASSIANYNGDDAVALFKISTDSYVDIIGRIGNDPGSAWTGANGYSTSERTLVRKSNVFDGVTENPTGTGADAFTTLTTEWDVFDQDYVGNLGMHDFDGGFVPNFVAGYQNLDVNNVTSFDITGLNQFTTYYYRVRAYTDGCVTANSNVTAVTTTGSVTWTMVDGTAKWMPEFKADGVTPTVIDNTVGVVIATDYNTSTDGEFSPESITVNSGTFTVASGTSITVVNEIVNNAAAENFIIENNANVIQINDINNFGDVRALKASSPLYRLDYTLWSAPVRGQNLHDFSPMTVPTRFYDYNETLDIYTVIDPMINNFEPGLSYLIRMPNNHPAFVNESTPGIAWTGTFEGVLNNGDYNVEMSVTANGYNLVGNPYPSPINIYDFYAANETTLQESSALYFFRKRNDTSATTSTYATITMAAYTANQAPGGDTGSDIFTGNPADWVINVGQGFFVQAAGGSIVFNNSMRRNVNNGQFFRTNQDNNTPDISRYWINLTNDNGLFSQMAVAYSNVTTNGIDYGWDGKALIGDGPLNVYSTAGENLLNIQAREAFTATDVVALGYNAAGAGTYTFTLNNTDGLFAEGQKIYLTDNLTGIVTDITESDYTFTTEAGQFNERFSVSYQFSALDTDKHEQTTADVVVYDNKNILTVSSANTVIEKVTVYDIHGRVLLNKKGNSAAELTLTEIEPKDQMLIISIATDKGTVTKKTVF